MAIEQALEELADLLEDRFTRSEAELEQHGHSEAYFANTPPDAVVFPRNTNEVSQIVKICAAHDCPVIGWGAGTSLEGHALAVRGGISVDFRHMNKVLDVNAEDMDVVVQPGITREELNQELRHTGLFFPVDPGANASLGGMASTRCSGTTAVRYGTMRENVIALEVVLADGRIIRTGTRARKSASGYDLTGMFVGAEGTLGLITELTVRLKGQPEAVSAATCAFPDMGAAIDTVIQTIQMGVPMARIEFIDAASAGMVNAYSGTALPDAPHLLIEFHGSDTVVAEQAETFGELARENGALSFEWSTKPEDRKRLWAARHNAAYAIFAAFPGKRGLSTDVCVPISNLAQAIAETQADIDASPLPGPLVGHVGDGNFHALLVFDPEVPAELDEAMRLSSRMADRALELGGTVTGEHGIGMGKLGYMQAEHGEAWDVMGQLKTAMDPQNIMNPGKLVRSN
ncbi:2-hydroxy-acid oxidase [Actibacterium mucosum KCTC 23349]|uniref:D-lactate dehydrogenase (cytochrome) n=1 Tax=Actibacterium mucosum KCTC 23349 TaxID=1454373 RepID=A0A037ZH03_9RHOB|nr:FAD-linked oxidase C-terminal domain-containing protein [Actibacterium mucosum]KAJ55740.1 2-hydroxy-acid oxidase [Actibacterium mucosum KCTC 23349]